MTTKLSLAALLVAGAIGAASAVHATPIPVPQDEMQELYYGINPPRHAEKAFQAGDAAPPISARPTQADPSGGLTVLVTTLYNRDVGARAEYAVWATATPGPNDRPVFIGSGVTPFLEDLQLTPSGQYFIQPRTVGTMAKLLPTDLTK